MTVTKLHLFQTYSILFLATLFTGSMILSSCSGDDSTGPQNPQIVDIAITPDNATFAVGEQQDFSVVALTATGDTVDTAELDIELQWWSTDNDVFTVEPGGLATGHNQGEAYCIVEAIINVSQHTTDLPDKLIVQAGILTDGQTRYQTQNLALSAGDEDVITKLETISINSMLRFTGRDSAFVMVF